jgi:hypothetical protein
MVMPLHVADLHVAATQLAVLPPGSPEGNGSQDLTPSATGHAFLHSPQERGSRTRQIPPSMPSKGLKGAAHGHALAFRSPPKHSRCAKATVDGPSGVLRPEWHRLLSRTCPLRTPGRRRRHGDAGGEGEGRLRAPHVQVRVRVRVWYPSGVPAPPEEQGAPGVPGVPGVPRVWLQVADPPWTKDPS